MTRTALLDAIATAEHRVAVTERMIDAARKINAPVDPEMLSRAQAKLDAARAALAAFDRPS